MADNNVNENEEIITIPDMVAKYITPEAFQELLDNNTVDQNCVYIVHYDVNTLPAGLSSDPILEVFIGSNRVSAIINLNNLPPIFDTKYINSDILSDRVADDISLSTTKEELVDRINATIEELGDADFTSATCPTLPSNLGLSNKLYLYFDAESSKYVMYIMHPQLKKLIPLKLKPAEGDTPTPTPPTPPTPSTTKLTLEYSAVIPATQASTLNIVGETLMFDLDSMSTIKFGQPGNPIVVQGKFAFWTFDEIEEYIRTSDEICRFITYNNCDLKFYYNNTLYDTTFLSDFMSLEYKTYINAQSQTVTNFFITTNNVFYQRGTAIPYNELSTLSVVKPGTTSWIDLQDSGYGTFGFTILAQSVQSPSVDPTNCPYGFVNAKLYFTITGQRGCTTIENCIRKLNGDTSVEYDSYLDVKIPFTNINEYYFSKSIITTSEVVINNA